jgi:hypothetical protein
MNFQDNKMKTKEKVGLNFRLGILLFGIVVVFGSCSSKVEPKKEARSNIIFLMDDQPCPSWVKIQHHD